jgi:MFS transporter, DHA1 family, tetracycline resistance protein
MRKPSLLIVWLTVFIDLIGFGIVVPMIPIFSARFSANVWVIGLVVASFSALQFVFAPIWGRLSDRVGRRPVLLLSTAGAALSYVVFAIGSGLENPTHALITLGIARACAGAFGGNITVAQAYIADITPAAQRSKGMGLIGMAFGLGFITGPAIGGFSLQQFGSTGPGWVAASLCAANFFLALAVLSESRQPGSEQVPQRPHFAQWRHTLTQPGIGLLVVVFFFTTLCFSCFEVTLAYLICANFGLDINDNATAIVGAYLFVYCGLISVFVQGGMIGPIVKRLGEPRLITVSLLITALSLALLPLIQGEGLLSWGILKQPAGLAWWGVLGALGLLALGSSLTRPPLFGMLSNLTAEHEQGANIGVAQAAGSLARIVGQFSAPLIFLEHSPRTLYFSCAGLLVVIAVITARRLSVRRP